MPGSTPLQTPSAHRRRTGRKAAGVLAALSVVASMAIATSPAVAATSVLAPSSIITTTGATGSGQTLIGLVTKNQSGTQDSWAKYVEFSPKSSAAYSGYRTYTVPGSVAPAGVTGIAVSVNYRGPATADQTWTWSLYNFAAATWSSVGTNATAPGWGSWKTLTFAGPAASSAPSFVSSTGEIRVRLGANNTSDSADLDFESVTVTSGSVATDTTAPTAPTGLAASATTTTSVSLAWNASSDAVGVTGYEVFQGTGTTPVATVGTTSATVTALAASSTYSFTVKARDAAGNRSAASTALAVTTAAVAPGGGGAGYTLPPANGKFDYQLGGSYAPVASVQIVSRDRTSTGVAGKYNVCYVNLLQTQPNEPGFSVSNPPYGTTQWWDNNHPDLLLRTASGALIIDPDWDEAIFDVSTAEKRQQLAAIQKPWFDGCLASGFQAIEPDNLDAETRQGSTLTHANIRDYMKIMVPYAHSIGLAIGQKNSVNEDEWFTDGKTFVTSVSPAQGFDFAIAEECQANKECNVYTDMYGGRVYEIEYSTAQYTKACTARGSQISVIDRDLNVKPAGVAGYRYSEC